MGLRSWWLSNKRERIEAKLKRLRAQQKGIREEEAELAREKKRGMDPATAEAREAKLRAEMERLTHDISRLLAEEEAVKAELQREERAQAA